MQSSRYSEERPDLAAVVDSHEVNIEMLSSDEGEQQANRFSLNNIHKKSGRSPYFEGGPVSPHREQAGGGEDVSSDKGYFEKRESLTNSFMRQAACYEY